MMISTIARSAKQAASLIRGRVSLLGPILVMVFVEFAADHTQQLLTIGELSPRQLWEKLVFEKWALLLIVLAVAVLLKSAFLLISSEDISLGFLGHGVGRYRHIVTRSPVKYYLINAGFTALWYAVFFSLASVLVLTASLIGDPAWEWLFVFVGFITGWPVYYAGVSVAAILIALRKHGIIAPGEWQAFLGRNLGSLYVFFAVRSVAELVVLVGGPALLILYVESQTIRNAAILLLVGVFTLFTRSATVAFTRLIYGLTR